MADITAYCAVVEIGRLRTGETILVHAGARQDRPNIDTESNAFDELSFNSLLDSIKYR